MALDYDKSMTSIAILKSKEAILSMYDNTKDSGKVKELYSALENARSNYLNSLSFEVMNRMSYDAALRSRKVDPFIAGGAGQAIGGIGAGVYGAVSAASRNEQIDAARKESSQKVWESSKNSAIEELRFIRALDAIEAVLFSNPSAKNYIDNKKREIQREQKENEERKRAEEAAKNKSLNTGTAIFCCVFALIIIISHFAC